MNKCLVIPDSFKGTMSSMEVCSIMKAEILKHFPHCQVVTIPVADGGEGTVDCFLEALGGERICQKVQDPYFQEIQSYYGISGETAIIEMASVAGLLNGREDMNPAKASTYGVGQLMENAINRGCREIILGLGGSCTNDGGTGAAAALGTKFFNGNGEEFIPTGSTLGQIVDIDNRETQKKLKSCQITVMCDVDNPLFGENGAAYVFAPQKGADKKMVKMLDQQLCLLSKTIEDSLGVDISREKGAGAGGGMGGGAKAFFGAEIKRGIDVVLDVVSFEEKLQCCGGIFTGEGKLDKQTLNGKVVIGIAKRAKKVGVPVFAVVGEIGDDIEEAYGLGVDAIFSTNLRAADYNQIQKDCRKNLRVAMDNILRLIHTMEKTIPQYK